MTNDAFHSIREGLEDAIEHAKGKDVGADEHEVEVVVIDVRLVRGRLGLSQRDFAKAFGVSVATIRNWEQGRRQPRGPARTLLMVIDKEPDAVQRALEQQVA
jgi:putative transcriptional regulator